MVHYRDQRSLTYQQQHREVFLSQNPLSGYVSLRSLVEFQINQPRLTILHRLTAFLTKTAETGAPKVHLSKPMQACSYVATKEVIFIFKHLHRLLLQLCLTYNYSPVPLLRFVLRSHKMQFYLLARDLADNLKDFWMAQFLDFNWMNHNSTPLLQLTHIQNTERNDNYENPICMNIFMYLPYLLSYLLSTLTATGLANSINILT